MYAMLKSEYIFNKKFKQYVDEYCYKNSCTKEDAFNKREVRQKFWKYTDV